MRGLWLWTLTLFSFALFLRGEEPLRLKLRHLKLPQNYAGIYVVHLYTGIDSEVWTTFPRQDKIWI